jgi:hypothetical protein
MATPLHYRSMPGALNVIVPPHVAPGAENS